MAQSKAQAKSQATPGQKLAQQPQQRPPLPNQILLIQNGDHLPSMSTALDSWKKSSDYADVVLHLSGGRVLRSHRLVLSSVSEYLCTVLQNIDRGRQHEEERELHISVPEVDFDALSIVLEFAYKGEARIPRRSVEAVCETANELKIKFLKDSFVKVNQKEYQDIKAGKRSLQSMSAASTKSPAASKEPPAKGKAQRRPATKKTGAAGNKKKKSDSDTDSAEEEPVDEKKRKTGGTAKPSAKTAAASASGSKSAPKSLSTSVLAKAVSVTTTASSAATTATTTSESANGNVLFTLTKQSEDEASKKVVQDGAYMVHFRPATGAPLSPGALISTAATGKPVQQRLITTTTKKHIPLTGLTPNKPVIMGTASPALSPQGIVNRVVLPSMPPKMKKVLIPPMGRMTSGLPTTGIQLVKSPTATAALPTSPLQLEVMKRPDGSEIQVLRAQPSTAPPGIMKQIRTVKRVIAPAPSTKVRQASAQSLVMPDGPDVRKLLASRTAAPLPKGVILLPKTPVPLSSITSPKPLATTPPVRAPVAKPKAPPKKTAASTAPAKSILPMPSTILKPSAASLAPHGVNPVISSTVPDDFLMTEDVVNTTSGQNAEVQEKEPAKAASEPPKKGSSSGSEGTTPAAAGSTDSVRVSGRARKSNPKYEQDKASASAKAGAGAPWKAPEEAAASTAKASRKRKPATDDKEQEGENQPPSNKRKAPNAKREPPQQQQQSQQSQQPQQPPAGAGKTNNNNKSNNSSNKSTKFNNKKSESASTSRKTRSTRSEKSSSSSSSSEEPQPQQQQALGKRVRKQRVLQ